MITPEPVNTTLIIILNIMGAALSLGMLAYTVVELIKSLKEFE